MKNFRSTDIMELQLRIKNNNESALKELYNYFSQRLFQFAYAIIHSKETAEEIIEDVFLQVWKKREKIAHIENFPLYLYVITRNISFNYLRHQNKKKEVTLNELMLPQYKLDVTPEDLMLTRETLTKINQAINELPPKCRIIFKLVKEDGLKYREAAELLNVSYKTIENQVGIALKKIHAAIDIHLSQSLDSLL